MTADEAFDNLMNKNALAIPVARAGGETTGGTTKAPPPRRPAGRPDDGKSDESTVRVSALFDEPAADADADYRPRGGRTTVDSQRGGVYSHPTETDLDAVGDAGGGGDDLSNANLHGARIVGRDTTVEGYTIDADDIDNGEDEYRDADVVDETGAGSSGSGTGLGLARRVQRFAYLPLSGMDAFESSARDMMARLTAINPARPSLAITSVQRGEGRTELAMRMALAMAKRVGHRVLLADFDVRKPAAAARLGVSSKYFTLADVLRGSCPLGEALVASEEDNLYVLPARPSDRDGDEILDSRQVEFLVGQLHQFFDFTIIDCGPASQADAVILCRLAGFTALAGYCRRSSAGRMNETAHRLEASGARMAGMVLTGA